MDRFFLSTVSSKKKTQKKEVPFNRRALSTDGNRQKKKKRKRPRNWPRKPPRKEKIEMKGDPRLTLQKARRSSPAWWRIVTRGLAVHRLDSRFSVFVWRAFILFVSRMGGPPAGEADHDPRATLRLKHRKRDRRPLAVSAAAAATSPQQPTSETTADTADTADTAHAAATAATTAAAATIAAATAATTTATPHCGSGKVVGAGFGRQGERLLPPKWVLAGEVATVAAFAPLPLLQRAAGDAERRRIHGPFSTPKRGKERRRRERESEEGGRQ
jgi:hypothetical protein